jgi:hypothetical protein
MYRVYSPLRAQAAHILVLVTLCAFVFNSVVLVAADQAAKTCSDGKVLVQSELKLMSTGCGAALDGVDFGDNDPSVCCHTRHACYSTCGAPKAHCDKEFTRCMKGLCKMSIDKFQKKGACEAKVETVISRLDATSKKDYSFHQFNHCDCVTKNSLNLRYMSFGTKFLESTVPSDAQLEKDLKKLKLDLMNVNNEGKEWQVLLDLYKRYPKGIPRDRSSKKKKGEEDEF